ncbi:MAG TPA: P-loop NTPase, partial [Actinomycetota bacterium]
MVTREEVYSALGQVMDPEIHRPITELEMVKSIEIADSGAVRVEVLLTVPGCPMKDRLQRDVTAAVSPLPGVTRVEVGLGSMTEEQRQALVGKLRGSSGQQQRKITFWGEESSTRVLAIASGKGGVGKSSVTVNLAAALAAQGHRVAVVDCDIYGFSVPRMLGATGRPVGFNGMIMPLEAHGVKVISIGMFTPGNTAVVWRGPMLHRALQQFLADV